uniref:Uncharacterized protein MANES_13G105100 n=1 Tax=Rhizophora mucronata TaxID=61149 RepID=A0A2P2KDZ7_RHIMU
MASEEGKLKANLKEKVFQTLKDFLTGVTKLEELGAIGSKFLSSFRQGLEFLRRPPINSKSELIAEILKANETKRLKSYVAAGCVTSHNSIQNTSKLNTSILGLHDHLSKAKSILNELEHLLDDLAGSIQTVNGCLSALKNKDSSGLDPLTSFNEEEISSSDLQELEITDCAALMSIIYSMVKQDYVMQERIVTSLNLKSSSEELESYCLMWSLHPFINDDIMLQAWNLV